MGILEILKRNSSGIEIFFIEMRQLETEKKTRFKIAKKRFLRKPRVNPYFYHKQERIFSSQNFHTIMRKITNSDCIFWVTFISLRFHNGISVAKIKTYRNMSNHIARIIFDELLFVFCFALLVFSSDNTLISR